MKRKRSRSIPVMWNLAQKNKKWRTRIKSIETSLTRKVKSCNTKKPVVRPTNKYGKTLKNKINNHNLVECKNQPTKNKSQMLLIHRERHASRKPNHTNSIPRIKDSETKAMWIKSRKPKTTVKILKNVKHPSKSSRGVKVKRTTKWTLKEQPATI